MRVLPAVFLAVLLAPPAIAQQAARDCPQCPEMVALPPGSFVMGAAPGEGAAEGFTQDYRDLSSPQVRVTIAHHLMIGKYEVTRAEFAAFVQATGHKVDASCHGLNERNEWTERQGFSWPSPGFQQTDRHPVVCVNAEDARLYAQWLTRITGKQYRLPTEAEWEYAARAGTQAARYWGEGRDGACRYANVADETLADALRDNEEAFACADGHVYTAPVGQYLPNAFGLHDMLGNAWELVSGCWTTSHTGAPANGDRRGDGDCSKGIIRGASWYSNPFLVRLAHRFWIDNELRESDVGFRVVRTD